MISSSVGGAASTTVVTYALCFTPSAAGATDAPTTTFTSALGSLTLAPDAQVPFTAAGTIMPGAGDWDVGLCIDPAADITAGTKQGFIQVTN